MSSEKLGNGGIGLIPNKCKISRFHHQINFVSTFNQLNNKYSMTNY